MTPEFFQAVAKMRELQKAYFASRDGNTLTQCKQAEAEVDRIIKKMTQPAGPSLFDQIDNEG